eukprot:CAMPEP_0198206586 /NCGR_PEP_ID=MMETSP1445-20131203/10149_1 /TAXON_ID=36898 /ORGANISM="Pyramimonas sp., Strain CCMP2087" /LENGTH=79 /DNA_ID=CAMNT_0043879349 /DNA_START=43 /DNA_END=282 /DNA_ORIENTATION=+
MTMSGEKQCRELEDAEGADGRSIRQRIDEPLPSDHTGVDDLTHQGGLQPSDHTGVDDLTHQGVMHEAEDNMSTVGFLTA